VQRLERWLQLFVWSDGCRVDCRCAFGTAHMVQLFERVSTFLLAVVAWRQRRFDEGRPYSAARRAWLARRGSTEASFRMIYIDDGIGATVHEPDEPLRRRTDHTGAVVDPEAEETGSCIFPLRSARDKGYRHTTPIRPEDRGEDSLTMLLN